MPLISSSKRLTPHPPPKKKRSRGPPQWAAPLFSSPNPEMTHRATAALPQHIAQDRSQVAAPGGKRAGKDDGASLKNEGRNDKKETEDLEENTKESKHERIPCQTTRRSPMFSQQIRALLDQLKGQQNASWRKPLHVSNRSVRHGTTPLG